MPGKRGTLITKPKRNRASLYEVLVGRQWLDISEELGSSDVLTVRCDLQYDQWLAPCITTIEKQLVLK